MNNEHTPSADEICFNIKDYDPEKAVLIVYDIKDTTKRDVPVTLSLVGTTHSLLEAVSNIVIQIAEQTPQGDVSDITMELVSLIQKEKHRRDMKKEFGGISSLMDFIREAPSCKDNPDSVKKLMDILHTLFKN